MADGTFAGLLIVLGLLDMGVNHCSSETGCLGKTQVTPRFSIAAGEVLPRRAPITQEVFLRYDLGHRNGPFGHAVGFSVGGGGEVWAGYGQTYHKKIGNSPIFAELHAMARLYAHNSGYQLGGPIEFRSGIEFGYENREGWRYGLSYDHRSNTGIYKANPGIETVMFRVSIPIK